MSDNSAMGCRLFQFGLAEHVLVTSALGIIWWQAAAWPVRQREIGPAAFFVPKPVYEISDGLRPPVPTEIAVRGLAGSVLSIIG